LPPVPYPGSWLQSPVGLRAHEVTMRCRLHRRMLAVLACGIAGVSASARADADLGPVHLEGWLEAGGRGVEGGHGSGKFEEYRDVRRGLFGAGDVMLEDSDRLHFLHFGGFDLGEKDADYFLEGGRWAHWGVTGSFSQLPRNFSNRALSPYGGIAGGDLTLP